MSLHSTRQPDDPGPASGICPCCNRPFPDEDADALRLLKANAGKVAAHRIALALRWPLHRLERFAAAQDAEKARAVAMKIDDGMTCYAIGVALNRTAGSVQQVIHREMIMRGLDVAHKHSGPGPDLLADRERRIAAEHQRTQTQTFFGDPPPGYSALDKKRSGLIP